MHPKRTRSSRPKLFQCTGFGDCNMVFTRSEHLARHSRKHTGEKPFICIVPLCAKAFSRFDNMMQHTQTHRNNHFNIVTPPNMNTTKNKKEGSRDTRSSTRTKVAAKTEQKEEETQHHSGLVSPVSLNSYSPKRHTRQCSLSSSDEEEEEEVIYPTQRTRRLSVADLCNPTNINTSNIHLTKDEFEALEGFGRFRHSPSVFFDSLKDLASNAHIEPY